MNRAKLDWDLRVRKLQIISEALGYVGIANTIEHPGYIMVEDPRSYGPEPEDSQFLACGFDGAGEFNIQRSTRDGRDAAGGFDLNEREDVDFMALCIGMALRGYALENTGGGCMAFAKQMRGRIGNTMDTPFEKLITRPDCALAPQSFASPCLVSRMSLEHGEPLSSDEYATVREVFDTL